MDKTVAVVGGTSGIGLRAVERLLDEGWTVWALGSRARLDGVRADTERLTYVQCDVRSADSIHSAFEKIREGCPALRALVYSAGVNITGELESISLDDADMMFDINLKGPWLTLREALPQLRRAASPDDPARVILVGSIGGIRPKVSGGIYGATKAADHVLAQVAAAELGPQGIAVNVLAPGSTDTPMIAAAAEAGKQSGYVASGTSPLGRIGRTDDVADVLLFLLSDSAKYVSGVVLPVDGGTRAAYINR